MALTDDVRTALLNRAIQLESRSFLEYLAQTAPPIDIAKHPAVKQGFDEIAREEDEIVDELVEMLEERGAHADALGSYDLVYTSYNYVTTEYALRVLSQHMAKALARFDAILAEAGGPAGAGGTTTGDEVVPMLRAIRERKARHLARLEELRAELKAPPKAAPATPPPAAAHGH